jgi:hypothetical protein
VAGRFHGRREHGVLNPNAFGLPHTEARHPCRIRRQPSGRVGGFMVRPLSIFQSSIFAICLQVIDGIMKLIDKIGIDVARKIVKQSALCCFEYDSKTA